MTADQFVALVAELRAAQKRFFSTRAAADLAESKSLERRVDHVVATWGTTPEPTLFDAGGEG